MQGFVSGILGGAPDLVMPSEMLGAPRPTEKEREMLRMFGENSKSDLKAMYRVLTELMERGRNRSEAALPEADEMTAQLAHLEILQKSVDLIEKSIKETDWPVKLREALMEIWNDTDGAIYQEARISLEASRSRQERLRGKHIRRGPDGNLELVDDEPNAE